MIASNFHGNLWLMLMTHYQTRDRAWASAEDPEKSVITQFLNVSESSAVALSLTYGLMHASHETPYTRCDTSRTGTLPESCKTPNCALRRITAIKGGRSGKRRKSCSPPRVLRTRRNQITCSQLIACWLRDLCGVGLFDG